MTYAATQPAQHMQVIGTLEAAEALLYAPAPAPQIVMRSHWPIYEEDEIAEVVDILRSGRVNALHHGDHTRAFERAFADYCGVPYAIAVANGTLALELALRALQIGPGDEVIVPARSFVASASCVAAVGAVPIFADVDSQSQTINAATVAAVLTSRTKAVLMVHIAGWPCPADEITVLARAYGLAVIEDCAQAHGAMVDGKPVGSLGDAAAFSFCTDKIMSTGGEGGMLLLRDSAAWSRAWAYKDHGKSPDAVLCSHSGGTFRWLHESLGSNWRLTEMQAAIGLRQLAKLPSWLAARRRNAAILDERLSDIATVRLTTPPPSVAHAYYKYYAFVRPERLARGWSRDRIIEEANAAGIPCGSGICPEIYRERAFEAGPSAPKFVLPCAHALGETSLMLPVDPTLNQTVMDAIGDGLASILIQAEA